MSYSLPEMRKHLAELERRNKEHGAGRYDYLYGESAAILRQLLGLSADYDVGCRHGVAHCGCHTMGYVHLYEPGTGRLVEVRDTMGGIQ